MKSRPDDLAAQDAHIGGKIGVHGVAKTGRLYGVDIGMKIRDLPDCVHTGVRPSRRQHVHGMTVHAGQPVLDHPLNGAALLLHLPAQKIRPVVGKHELYVAFRHRFPRVPVSGILGIDVRADCPGLKALNLLPHLLVDFLRVIQYRRGAIFG